MLPVVANALNDAHVTITSVLVRECRNQYAHVTGYVDQSGCPPVSKGRCYQNANVFLKAVAGEWQYIIEGSGLACDDPDQRTPTEFVTACIALGLR